MVLTVISCCGCSAGTTDPESTKSSDKTNQQTTIIIKNESPAQGRNIDSQNSAGNVEAKVDLTSQEKEVLELAHEQVNSVIEIIQKVVDTETATQSLQSLCDARTALQKTRNKLRNSVSNQRKRFLLFSSAEGKLLQQAMWKMKKELVRLESNKEIQVVLTDGMADPAEEQVETNLAQEERKKFTVTANASNITVDDKSVTNASSEK